MFWRNRIEANSGDEFIGDARDIAAEASITIEAICWAGGSPTSRVPSRRSHHRRQVKIHLDAVRSDDWH
jgi:hypothetical protein